MCLRCMMIYSTDMQYCFTKISELNVQIPQKKTSFVKVCIFVRIYIFLCMCTSTIFDKRLIYIKNLHMNSSTNVSIHACNTLDFSLFHSSKFQIFLQVAHDLLLQSLKHPVTYFDSMKTVISLTRL